MKNLVFIMTASVYLLLFMLFPLSLQADQVAVDTLLKDSDFYRGGRIEGVSWNVHVKNIEQSKIKNEISVEVDIAHKKRKQFALINFLTPVKYRGQKLLLREHNMWFSKPSLRRPVPISSRQRLSGAASNADIASANYFEDYTAQMLSPESIDGIPCYTLELIAKTNLVSYYRIKYWVQENTHQGLKAEFYGKAGKLIKTARFKYNNKIMHNDKEVDFISDIIINDNINKEDFTTLTISNVALKTFSSSNFQQKRMIE